MEHRRSEAGGGRRRGRKLYHKRPFRSRVARRVEEEDNDSAPLGVHWYIIGLSILLVAGLSIVNVLALPDKPGGIPHQHNLRFPVVPSATLAEPPHPEPGRQLPTVPEEPEPSDLPGWRQSYHPVPTQPSAKAVPGPQKARPPSPQVREFQQLAERNKNAGHSLPSSPEFELPPVYQIDIKKAAGRGGVATFEGDGWLSVSTITDADEITFSAWIFVPEVPQSSFPGSSGSMKSIASTKVSGCAVSGQDSDGWSLWVHEWGTTNRQLRLSWTSGGSACNELFSRTQLVPFDQWTLVGFSLSRASNRASLFLGGSLIADTRMAGVGEVARAGALLPMEQADVASRAVHSRGAKAELFIGAHKPQPKDANHVNSHVFIGYIADVRLLQVAGKASYTVRLLAMTPEELLHSGLVPSDAVALQVQFQPKVEPENLVDGAAFTARRADSPVDDKEAVRVVPFAERPRHPIFMDTGVSASPPGPTLDPEALRSTWPAEWTRAWSEQQLLESQREADAWADEVRDAMRHTWAGYRQKAWGHDEVKPLSGGNKDWCKLAITMLDALSTLWIMGLKEEFDAAEQWLRENPQPSPGKHGMNSLFEINIRAVGGLLSAYSLSGRRLFLETAQRLVDNMLPAFNTVHGMPHSSVDVGTGESGKHTWQNEKAANTVLAEVSTVQVEFRFLSHVTGNMAYQKAADKAENAVLAAAGSKGIIPLYLNHKVEHPSFVGSKISFGAMGDSYYEYLLKQWVQSGRKEGHFKEAWKLSIKEMISQLVMKTQGGLTFIAEKDGGKQKPRMDHLACFVSGMLMLGARTLPKEEVNPYWEELAAEVARTCYEMYRRSPSGLSPEYIVFRPDSKEGDDTMIPNDAPHNLLRPEAIEALYYMWYYTGDPKYRRWAHEMWSAFQKHSRVRFGFSSVGDVRKMPPPKRDSQESFWLAETLKYFYLIFSPRNTLSLEEFVLNTEAHPLRIWS